MIHIKIKAETEEELKKTIQIIEDNMGNGLRIVKYTPENGKGRYKYAATLAGNAIQVLLKQGHFN